MASPVFPARPVRPVDNFERAGKLISHKLAGSRLTHEREERNEDETERTNSMNVSLNGVRHLPVDDKRDVGYIDTTTSLRNEKTRKGQLGVE